MKVEKKVNSEKYIQAVGRRKTSIARVRLFVESDKTGFAVNDKDLATYFPTEELQRIVMDPLTKSKISIKYRITAKIKGGGIHSQAEAFRHGISRTLILHDVELRKKLKKLVFCIRNNSQ